VLGLLGFRLIQNFFPKYIFIILGYVSERLCNQISADFPLRRDSAHRRQLKALNGKCSGHDIILNIFRLSEQEKRESIAD